MKLGFGAWQLGGECTFGGRQTGWGKIDIQEAKKAVQAALHEGITFFDTAPGYGKGASEELLGSVFGQLKPQNLQVCTKYGSYEDSAGNAYVDFSAVSLRKSVEASLKRLQIESLDTILLHSPPDDFREYAFEEFEKLKEEGKISHYGVSVKSLKGALNTLENNFGDSIEAIFNVLDRRAAGEVFPHAAFDKYQFIARVPLASGLLSDKFLENPEMVFGKTDIRSAIGDADRSWYKEVILKLSFLKELPGGVSTSALRYVLHHPEVSYVIPGMYKYNQLQGNLLAIQLGQLPAEAIKMIEEAIPHTNPNWLPKI